MSRLPGDPSLPPGVSQRELDNAAGDGEGVGLPCDYCGEDVPEDDLGVCADCGEMVCKKHLEECRDCGNLVCEECWDVGFRCRGCRR